MRLSTFLSEVGLPALSSSVRYSLSAEVATLRQELGLSGGSLILNMVQFFRSDGGSAPWEPRGVKQNPPSVRIILRVPAQDLGANAGKIEVDEFELDVAIELGATTVMVLLGLVPRSERDP